MKHVEAIVSEIKKRSPGKVFVQVPEGLKTKLQEIETELDREGIESLGSLEPCYGACDIKDREARELGCDLLVHIGHSKFCKTEEIETVYFPWYYDIDPTEILEGETDKLEPFDRIGLVTSINFKPAFEKTRELLEDSGKEVLTASGGRTEEGQILGCDIGAGLKISDRVDCFLYIGSGKFHPLGLGIKTDKPVYVLDFENSELYEPDFDRFERQKYAAVENARGVDRFGILVSTKKGQSRPELASSLKEELEDEGKEAWIFTLDEIKPEKLKGTDVDCWVNTACPRIAIEHRTEFGETILNPEELRKAIT